MACSERTPTPTSGPSPDTGPTTVRSVPGTGPLVVYSVTGFTGYAALLPSHRLGGPRWRGRRRRGLVNGVLLATTVVAQLAVPWTLRTLGHGRTMAPAWC